MPPFIVIVDSFSKFGFVTVVADVVAVDVFAFDAIAVVDDDVVAVVVDDDKFPVVVIGFVVDDTVTLCI